MQEDDIELSPDLSAREYARRQAIKKRAKTPHSVNITFTEIEHEDFCSKKKGFEEEVGFPVSKAQFVKSLIKNASF